jgi:hypothetical protein
MHQQKSGPLAHFVFGAGSISRRYAISRPGLYKVERPAQAF